jgi:hypothetical protein
MKNEKLMNSRKAYPWVIARSVATKQSHQIKLAQNTRLLRSARNDKFEDSLRIHQIRRKMIENFAIYNLKFAMRF